MIETKFIGMAARRHEGYRFAEDRQECTLQFAARLGADLLALLDNTARGLLTEPLIELQDVLIAMGTVVPLDEQSDE